MSSTNDTGTRAQPVRAIGLQPLCDDCQQTYLANDHRGVGDQHVGPLTDLGTKAHIITNVGLGPARSHKLTITISLFVLILAIVGIVIGIVLRKNDNTSKDINNVDPSPSFTSSLAHSTSSETHMSHTSFQSPLSATSVPAPECLYSCYKDYIRSVGCQPRCPGASCSDDTGCSDPWPCISNTCCNTGCLPGWSCEGVCSTTDTMNLVCVSNTDSSIPDASTCRSVSSITIWYLLSHYGELSGGVTR
ncbi:hypothetical protein F4803DRAFT_544939 [Xylaria telfairii]|nr:hypothetical protein F4803DRAFT_544939 [Xylaria telfairii]